MKTLLSINNYHYVRGGAEVVYLAHNELFRQHGWNVAELAMNHPQNLPSDWDQHFVEEIELGRKNGIIGSVRKAAKSIYSRESYRSVRDLVARSQPRIVHAHNVYHHLSNQVFTL